MEQISLICTWSLTKYYSMSIYIAASDMIKTYIHAWWLRLPRFESCSQQREATARHLSIRKFLACARRSKLTTTKIYIHGVLLYCVSCPRNTDYWCCPISSSTFFTQDFIFIYFYLHFWSSSNARAMKKWSVLYACVQMLWHVFTAKYWYNKSHWWIHNVFLHFHRCRPIFFFINGQHHFTLFLSQNLKGYRTRYFVLWDWNSRCPNVDE